MSYGAKIAKPGRQVTSKPSEMYVDTDTPLLKVHKSAGGSLILSGTGTTPKSVGEYQWTYTGQQFSDQASYQLVIPHTLLYVPQFLVYMDIRNLADRRYVTSWIAASALDGDMYVTAQCSDRALTINAYASQGNSGLNPRAGTFGFFAYIFHEAITPPELMGSL